MTDDKKRQTSERRGAGPARRYFLVLGVILAAAVGGLLATKPQSGELQRKVEGAMAAYAKAQAAAPPGTLPDLSLPEIATERDWILARSYSALRDGERFSCWGVSVVTVCNSPD